MIVFTFFVVDCYSGLISMLEIICVDTGHIDNIPNMVASIHHTCHFLQPKSENLIYYTPAQNVQRCVRYTMKNSMSNSTRYIEDDRNIYDHDAISINLTLVLYLLSQISHSWLMVKKKSILVLFHFSIEICLECTSKYVSHMKLPHRPFSPFFFSHHRRNINEIENHFALAASSEEKASIRKMDRLIKCT